MLSADEPEVEALIPMIELGMNAVMAALGFSSWALGWRRAFRRTILVYLVLSTLTVIVDCANLVSTLTDRPTTNEGAFALLWDAALTWVANLLTFAVWYWFLDQGGPDRRRSRPVRFRLPPTDVDHSGLGELDTGPLRLRVRGFQYETSTAFSPTDTVVLSSKAKVLCMLQAGISLIIIAMLAARVVNTIQ